MRVRRALALASAALAAATGVLLGAAPAQAATTQIVPAQIVPAQIVPAQIGTAAPVAAAVTLANTISLSNCSASLVRFPASVSSDRAMMLTNGHCYEGGFINAGVVLRNRTSSRSGTLLNSSGRALATVRADRVIYATMTGTDVTLYRLTSTFATLSSRYGAAALTIASGEAAAGSSVSIPSSYWKEIWNCKIDSYVPTLREDQWTWHDSLRYDTACDTIHGTSGSPIVSNTSGQLVGINNTGNDDGEMCTLDNPCEVDADGTTHAYPGQSYGEETYWFTTCVSSSRTIDLTVAGCLLTKPAA